MRQGTKAIALVLSLAIAGVSWAQTQPQPQEPEKGGKQKRALIVAGVALLAVVGGVGVVKLLGKGKRQVWRETANGNTSSQAGDSSAAYVGGASGRADDSADTSTLFSSNVDFSDIFKSKQGKQQGDFGSDLGGAGNDDYTRPNFADLGGAGNDNYTRPNFADLGGMGYYGYTRPNFADLGGMGNSYYTSPNFNAFKNYFNDFNDIHPDFNSHHLNLDDFDDFNRNDYFDDFIVALAGLAIILDFAL